MEVRPSRVHAVLSHEVEGQLRAEDISSADQVRLCIWAPRNTPAATHSVTIVGGDQSHLTPLPSASRWRPIQTWQVLVKRNSLVQVIVVQLCSFALKGAATIYGEMTETISSLLLMLSGAITSRLGYPRRIYNGAPWHAMAQPEFLLPRDAESSHLSKQRFSVCEQIVVPDEEPSMQLC